MQEKMRKIDQVFREIYKREYIQYKDNREIVWIGQGSNLKKTMDYFKGEFWKGLEQVWNYFRITLEFGFIGEFKKKTQNSKTKHKNPVVIYIILHPFKLFLLFE